MNPLDEIEMEMGGKLKVGQEVIIWQTGYKGCIIATDKIGPHDICFVDEGGQQARPYFPWQLTPTGAQQKPVEPERVKAPRMPDCTYPGSCVNPLSVCFGCGWRKVEYAPSPGLLQRMGMCTYPELFICEKAGECNWKCFEKQPHGHFPDCELRCTKGATCIPYVPEDEAREWFVVAKDTGAWVDGSGLLDTKERALELIRARQRHNLRAFRWSDGLR